MNTHQRRLINIHEVLMERTKERYTYNSIFGRENNGIGLKQAIFFNLFLLNS